MRTLLKVSIPVEAGNRAIAEGILPKTVGAFVEQHHPESTFFTAINGQRTAFFVFDLKDSSSIPSIAEPFFMSMNASVEFLPVMNLEEMKIGVDRAVKNLKPY